MIHGIISILIALIVVILYLELRKLQIKKKLLGFGSPKQIPVLGVAGRFFGKSNDTLLDLVLQGFDEFKTTPGYAWFGPILFVGICEPHDIQTILTDENCLNKPYFYEHLHCKSSIIVTDRETWKHDRRALNAAFNVKMLQNYVPLLNEKSHILVEQLTPFLNRSGDIYRTIFIGMIDSIVRTTMGCDMHLQSDRGAFIYDIVKQIMNNIQYRVSRFWLQWDFIYTMTQTYRDEKYPLQDGNNFIEEIYMKRSDELEYLLAHGIDYLEDAKEKNAMNLLEKALLLERERVFTHENVLDQMRVIILAGIDTSSITVFGTLLMLAINQKHQDLVVAELRSIFETADCDVTQTHLNAMKYTERAIKESMRLIPPVPFIGRKTSADIALMNGTIPKHTIVFINIMRMHRDPTIWGQNVLEFDPDRFLPENVAKRPPFSYVPFSAGPRNCIGMKYAMISSKITLAHLLRRYKFTTNLRFDEIRVKTHLVLEIINSSALSIEKRVF